jgi:hypothetical protein
MVETLITSHKREVVIGFGRRFVLTSAITSPLHEPVA